MVFVFLLAFGALAYDVVIERNLMDKTILLFGVALNVGIFGLLADMIVKRIGP